MHVHWSPTDNLRHRSAGNISHESGLNLVERKEIVGPNAVATNSVEVVGLITVSLLKDEAVFAHRRLHVLFGSLCQNHEVADAGVEQRIVDSVGSHRGAIGPVDRKREISIDRSRSRIMAVRIS